MLLLYSNVLKTDTESVSESQNISLKHAGWEEKSFFNLPLLMLKVKYIKEIYLLFDGFLSAEKQWSNNLSKYRVHYFSKLNKIEYYYVKFPRYTYLSRHYFILFFFI